MGTAYSSMFCPRCRVCRQAVRQTPSHGLHLLITVLTFGFWLWVWLAVILLPKPWRCSHCGSMTRVARSVRFAGWIVFLVAAILIGCLLLAMVHFGS